MGLALAPDPEWLSWCEPLLDALDYASVTPETLWRGPALELNGYGRAFAAMRQERDLSFVAHSTAYSLGSAGGDDRRARWRAAMARAHAAFEFQWWTDHSAMTIAAGENLTLPLPLPFTAEAASRMRARFGEMATVVSRVGMENSAHVFLPGPALEEPDWIRAALGPHHWLLDLHNLWAMSRNFDFDPEAWLARAPLERVIEIHVAGGVVSPSTWDVRPMRLDGHDAAVPAEVWTLLRRVLPECVNVEGVTLERIEGTVKSRIDQLGIARELDRIRELLS